MERQQTYDVSEPNVDVTQVAKVVGVANERSGVGGRVQVQGWDMALMSYFFQGVSSADCEYEPG